jgi:hypothetical protein
LKINGKIYPSGAQIVKYKKGLLAELHSIADNLLVNFEKITVKPEGDFFEIKSIRLSLYKSWAASIDEGWTRWVLEQYEFPFQSLFNEDIQQGRLGKKIDVLILPDMAESTIVKGVSEKNIPLEYAGGIGELGINNIKKFVENGGALITLNSAADFAIKHFSLAIDDSSKKLERKEFFVPGSILKARIDNTHPVGFGFEKEASVFFHNSPIFKVGIGKTIVSYPEVNPLLSGWLTGEKYLSNKSAIVEVPYGKGKIILIGFPAMYRGQAHGTFRFLFNAIYYGNAKVIKFQ